MILKMAKSIINDAVRKHQEVSIKLVEEMKKHPTP